MEYFYINKIENLKTEIFEDKEHYLAFRQAWKDYINSGKHKPVWEEKVFTYNKRTYIQKTKVSNLNGSQQLLFCLLTEKDLRVTFKPSDNKEGKNGFGRAYFTLIHLIHSAAKLHEFETTGDLPLQANREYYQQYHDRIKKSFDRFLEPFGGTVTIEMLAQIQAKYYNSPKTHKHYFLTNRDPEEAREKDQAA